MQIGHASTWFMFMYCEQSHRHSQESIDFANAVRQFRLTGGIQTPREGRMRAASITASTSAADEDLEEREDEINADSNGVHRKNETQITAFASRRWCALLRARGLTLVARVMRTTTGGIT